MKRLHLVTSLTCLVVLGLGSIAEAARAQATNTPAAQTGLVGKWQGPEGVVEINPNGSLTINGTLYRYTATNSTLTLIGYDGQVAMPFTLQGNTLSVVLNGVPVTLTRITATNPAGGAGAGGSPMALVGKWCYFSNINSTTGGGRMTSECITLNGDGSFLFYQDTSDSNMYGSAATNGTTRGSWTATATTITATIPGQGSTTYALQKRNHPKNVSDPMICLDGRCYVTYGPRRPW
jgi:hypothetical protein